MLTSHSKTNLLGLFAFPIIIIATFLIYYQGINSPFIFDDIPNLNPMGKHQPLGFWHDVGLFLLQGDSGPTGRPLSLISFYLNDTSYQGASAASFKYTNILLHLLNGVLIFWLTLKLTHATNNLEHSRNYWIAILACGIWLLHPIQLNTVLYVVQRMTELSTLFMLTGILSYLYGRDLLDNRPLQGWLWMVLGGGISLLLSILSKETGVMLVVYILVIEYTLLRPFGKSSPKHLNIGLSIAVWLPFLLLLSYLLMTGLNSGNYGARPFDASQRLLTEARVLWDYISSILLPNPSKLTLFHDDFPISRHWLEPITTLPAILGIVGLIGLALWVRVKQPVITFAIAWFLGGHLLESTTVPLELYFEHRNYLPLFGIAFALSWYAIAFTTRWRWAVQLVVAGYLITALAVTQHGVVQWTNPLQMVAGWLQDHPRSQRTMEALDALIGEQISPDTRQQLLQELRTVSVTTQSSSYLIFRDLELACQAKTLQRDSLMAALTTLATSGYVNSTSKAYANFVVQWLDNRCGSLSAEALLNFTETLRTFPNLQQSDMLRTLHYWQAEIQVTQGNLDQTMHHMETAYQLQPSLDLVFIQVHYLRSAGLYEAALTKLQEGEQDLCKQWRSCMVLRLRSAEIESLTTALQQQLQKQQEALAHDHSVDHIASQK